MAETGTAERPEALAQRIAAELGETEPQPQRTILRSVRVLGAERALAFLEQAREVERQGGLMLPDGSRRRTCGGVYFRLLRDGVTSTQRWQIFAPLPQPTTAPRAEGRAAALAWIIHEDRRGVARRVQRV